MPAISRYYDVHRDAAGNRYLEVFIAGLPLQRMPLLNKGTAFTPDERRLLELEGLLPPNVTDLELQKDRVYRQYKTFDDPIQQHIHLRALQDRNEVLFYALLADHLEEMLPVIYTPTVAEAVRRFSEIYRLPRGLAISTSNISEVDQALANVPLNDVRLAVATDSSAILGIGDQGFGGMAISIGKLSIYTVAGGVGPDKTLPIELDVGTDRAELLDDPLYLGVRHRRLHGDEYFAFLDRFVEAIIRRYPGMILQWEDFAKDVAFAVLERYRKWLPSFNDDIQGTGATALAGVLSACRMTGERLADQRMVVYGAGAGGIGVAWAMRQGLIREGLSPDEARARVLVLDSKGLLFEGRDMEPFKRPYAQPASVVSAWGGVPGVPHLLDVIANAKATVLLGLSGQGGSFDRQVVEAMGRNARRPVIFPLSNPLTACEATPADVLAWSGGAAIVATGSPYPPVEVAGQRMEIGQGNNAFIFPGLGFGAVLGKVSEISDAMVLAAADALARFTQREPGRVYPPVREMRSVSIEIATAVIEQGRRDGVVRDRRLLGLSPEGIAAYVRDRCWIPHYLPYRRAEGGTSH